MYIFSAKKLLTMGITARYSTDPPLRICASRVITTERRSADEMDHRDQDSQRFLHRRLLPPRAPPRSAQQARVRYSRPWVDPPDKLVMASIIQR